MENIMQRRLRLWKARQEAEGYDVSKVTTLEEAEHFFDKKPKKKTKKNKESAAETAAPEAPAAEATAPEAPAAETAAPEMPEEEVIEDEQCDIDPPGMPE